jgi:site-specific DNA-cytosine methylase
VFIVASRRNHRRPVEILFESESSSGYLEKSGKKRKRFTAETERSLNRNSSERIIPIHDKATRFNGKRGNKNDGSGNGLGIGNLGDPMNTLTTNDKHSVFIETATLLRMRGGKEGGGKGALVSEDKSLTLATGNDQTLFLFQCNRKDDHRIHQEVSPTLGCFVGSIPLAFSQNLASGKDITNTITANLYHHGTVVNQDVSDGHLIVNQTTVRKITPKECERLQGFPDDWTNSQANSSRYKMLGNAVTVPVVEWIIKRMVKLISE